jgi:membrane protease YdiL (CAAX protease family)
MNAIPRSAHRSPGLPIIAAALAVFGAAWYWLTFRLGTEAGDTVFLVVVMGVCVPAVVWAATRGAARTLAAPAPASGREVAVVLCYLAAFALLILGEAFTALKHAIPTEPAQDIAKTGLKLVTMVLLPWLLLARFGSDRLPGLAPQWRRIAVPLGVVGALLFAIQAVFGRGLHNLGELHPEVSTLLVAIPACFLWMTLSAGLCEELLFRVFLQDRLAAWFRSPVAGVLVAALLFGLAHAPGLYLRGGAAMEGQGEVSIAWAVAYTLVVVAPAGVAFGVLWLRTRNLWLGVILHGLMDTLPNLAGFIRDWMS